MMRPMNRRQFLIGTGVTAAGALAVGAAVTTLPDLLRAAERSPLEDGTAVLVLVTLYGGNDGLSTVVPATDPAYRAARPDLAYREDEVLPLGDGLGLNPAMKGFAQAWKRRELAIIRGVSYPEPDRSHFTSMAIWQTAAPEAAVKTGWIGRWLDASTPPSGVPRSLLALSIGSTVPPSMAGETVAGAAYPLDPTKLPSSWRETVAGLAVPMTGEHPLQSRVSSSLADLLAVDERVGGLIDAARNNADEDEAEDNTAGASAGGHTGLDAQLEVVASAIAARVPTRVYEVSLGGLDTHSNQKETQSRIMGVLDGAVTRFRERVRAERPETPVVVAVHSEFGRRVRANGNEGTDHGTSGPVFVLGDGVNGGFHGDQPSLTRLDGSDLAVTTDFRDVYATLLDGVLRAEPARFLEGRDRTLGFL
jgi:uncharacterized protein (DUF1501 family)